MIIIIWIFLCIIIAIGGSKRNIGGAGAFFISLFLSPIVGFIVVMLSEPKTLSSSPLIVVNKDGSDQTFQFKKININVPYIQKSPTTGAYKVYKKTDDKSFIFLKDFNGYVEAKKYVIKMYENSQEIQIKQRKNQCKS